MSNWRKSSHSDSNGCVELCHVGTTVFVRDTKNSDGPALGFARPDMAALITTVSAVAPVAERG